LLWKDGEKIMNKIHHKHWCAFRCLFIYYDVYIFAIYWHTCCLHLYNIIAPWWWLQLCGWYIQQHKNRVLCCSWK